MTNPRTWYRCSIDLDPAGNPVGSSIKVYANDQLVTEHVLPAPGPFDTRQEVLEAAYDHLAGRYGVPIPLW